MRDLAIYALACFLWTLGLASCADPSASTPRAPAPTHYTPGGVPVVAPAWLTRDPALLAEALDEIDAAGLPEGWTVAIRIPKWETPHSPTGLARGLCWFDRRLIEVGFRFAPFEDRPLLPALLHEREHAVEGR